MPPMKRYLAAALLSFSSLAATQVDAFEACEEDMKEYHNHAVAGVLAREAEPTEWRGLCYYNFIKHASTIASYQQG